MLGLFGCGKRYKVDYDGSKDWFKGAKDSYRAGERVRVCYNMIATDTSYYFYLDDVQINPEYDDRDGYIITFIMPEHDVKLTVTHRNTMIAPDPIIEGFYDYKRLVYESFDGGGPSYEAEADNPHLVYIEKKIEYNNPDHDKMEGCSYEVIFIIRGLEPGQTKLTITSHSPIDGTETKEEHTVTVNEYMKVKLD